MLEALVLVIYIAMASLPYLCVFVTTNAKISFIYNAISITFWIFHLHSYFIYFLDGLLVKLLRLSFWLGDVAPRGKSCCASERIRAQTPRARMEQIAVGPGYNLKTLMSVARKRKEHSWWRGPATLASLR